MGVRGWLMAGMAAAALSVAGVASASTATIDFTIEPGNWTDLSSPPFGMSSNPTVTGSVTVESHGAGTVDGSAFAGLNYTTGTKNWTLSDINIAQSYVRYSAPDVVDEFAIVFNGLFNYIYSNNTVRISDTYDGLVCNFCVVADLPTTVPSGVPEPATWAMLILGLALAGAAARLRREGAALAA